MKWPPGEKVKATLTTVLDRGLHALYPRIYIYILTEKRASRAQRTIDKLTDGRIRFDVKKDILDFRDVLRKCGSLEVGHLERVVDILKKHLADTPRTTAPDAPARTSGGYEPVELNLVPITFPDTLYVADYIAPEPAAPIPSRHRRPRRQPSPRHNVVQDIMRRGLDAPEDFEIHADRLISLHDPTAAGSPLVPYLDLGTLTPLPPRAYYGTDPDQLRVFKALLRRALQRQLRPEFILWQHDERLFFYAPVRGFETRVVMWQEERSAERTVSQATMKRDKPEEILTCKHFAFYADFHLIEEAWYMAITPTWYFSRDGYRPDGFAGKRISWLKAQEHDQQVHTHLRFLCHHLRVLQEQSLFDGPYERTFIRISDSVRFRNHPYLPDHLWNPQGPRSAEDEGQGSLSI